MIAPTAGTAQPWKNGGGVTIELVRWPATAPDDAYDVRVSLAEVTASGPFSQFPGYRRWTFLAGLAPIELAPADAPPIELTVHGDHVELPGETEIHAQLRAGPTHLLNILSRTPARTPIVVGHGPTVHPVRLAFALIETAALARWSTAVIDPPAAFDTTGCVWIA